MITMTKKLDFMMKQLKKLSAETFYHSLRVKKLTYEMMNLANQSGLANFSSVDFDIICKGALLHDIGKLNVDNVILTKEKYLTEEEKAVIREHVRHGSELIIDELEPEEKEVISNICFLHHERIDGSGYSGQTEIPLYVQIVSICDVFDALHTDRIYRDGFSVEKTMEMLRSGASGKFDEKLLDLMEQISKNVSSTKQIW